MNQLLASCVRPACLLVLFITAALPMTGCSVSRHQEIKRLSDRVEKDLKSEQREVLTLDAGNAERATRLDHLTSLKTTHSIADVGLATAPRLLEGDDLSLAYDILEEAYQTIEWNVPLLPGQGTRDLPNAFGPSGHDFNALRAGMNASDASTPSGFVR